LKRLTVAIYVWVLSLLACAALAAFSFVRLDVPLAWHFWNAARLLSPLAEGFGAAVLLTVESLVILTIVLARLVRGHISPFGKNLAIACLSSICAYGVNDHVLKLFFGVPNPAALMRGAGHSIIFFSGSEHSSFPSGHMAMAAAFAGVFMRLYAVSIWPLSALLVLAASLLLVGDWHFLSDIIAGTFFGLSAGLLAGEGRAAHLE
jgi:membrane-associated phospholipid phosphatase